MGFALQLCALRYPGRPLQPGETIPERMLAFIGAQLGLSGEALIDYGAREGTRYQHSAALQRLYGYRLFEGRVREEVRNWLAGAAETARSNAVNRLFDQLAWVRKIAVTETLLDGTPAHRVARLRRQSKQ